MQAIKKIFITLFLLFSVSLVGAQQLPLYSQFVWNDFAINPAYTGSYDYSPLRMVYRKQWSGFNGSPTLFTLGGHTRVSEKIALGGILFKDETGGAITQSGALLNYAYRIALNDSSFLNFGLSAQFNQYVFDNNKVTALQPNDPVLLDGVQKTMATDASFGMMYQNKRNLRIGASINQLFESGLNNLSETGENKLVRHFNIHGSREIELDSNFSITPMVLVRKTATTPIQFDITAKLDYRKFMWIGGSVRPGDAIVAMAGFNLKNVFIGYSYDMTTSELANYSSGSHEVVLGLNLGGKNTGKNNDRDKDGIPDDKDQCPDQKGVKSNNGCPLADRDSDGISDAIDQCPDQAGPLSNSGCPSNDFDKDGIPNEMDLCPDVFGVRENSGCPLADRDRDGIADFVDRCPDQAGALSNEGCPVADRDMDGVADLYDRCPDVRGLPSNNGCPLTDMDQDGIADIHDRCPTIPGTVRNNGCPDTSMDSDGDGIPNYLDQCPNTPGMGENNGCPVVTKKQKDIVSKAISNLEFETNSATIKNESFGTLDMLAIMLDDKADWNLKIAGHTDDVGTEEYNLDLSKRRAESVRDYLISKGVSSDRFVVEYFGKSRPISTNQNEVGRSKNRRVEMILVFD